MGNRMAILHEIDKCVRCNGCVLACKREWQLKNAETQAEARLNAGMAAVNPRQRLAIKSQRKIDMGPFVRFTCWHCPDPPCADACPFGAIVKQENGAVSVDNDKCQPSLCRGSASDPTPCQTKCQRGGYPKVGVAYENHPGMEKMNKCTLCNGRAGSDAQITAVGGVPALGLPTRATQTEITAVNEKLHEPACVSSCPAKAMKWDTRANIITYLNANYVGADGTPQWIGDGSIMWASKKSAVTPPKADPFVEDHIVPIASSLLSGSGRMVLPTLVIGGLAALSARRAKNEEDASTGEEV